MNNPWMDKEGAGPQPGDIPWAAPLSPRSRQQGCPVRTRTLSTTAAS